MGARGEARVSPNLFDIASQMYFRSNGSFCRSFFRLPNLLDFFWSQNRRLPRSPPYSKRRYTAKGAFVGRKKGLKVGHSLRLRLHRPHHRLSCIDTQQRLMLHWGTKGKEGGRVREAAAQTNRREEERKTHLSRRKKAAVAQTPKGGFLPRQKEGKVQEDILYNILLPLPTSYFRRKEREKCPSLRTCRISQVPQERRKVSASVGSE